MFRALAFAAWALTARTPAETPTRDGLPLDVWRAQRVADDWYRDAIETAAEEVGRPDLALELWRICRRESRCGQYGTPGVHERDAWVGRRVHARAVERGLLDPDRCEEHRITDARPARAFATRGGFGQIAAYSIYRLEPYLAPGGCVAPEVLDQVGSAALSAVLAMVEVDPWGQELRPTCPDRLSAWAGAGKVATWSNRERRRRMARQCGPQDGLTLAEFAEDLALELARHWRVWAVSLPDPDRAPRLASFTAPT